MQKFLYWLQLVRGGMLRTLNTDETTGGVAVFRAESEDAARGIMNSDPAVQRELMTATLYPFKVILQGKIT